MLSRIGAGVVNCLARVLARALMVECCVSRASLSDSSMSCSPEAQ